MFAVQELLMDILRVLSAPDLEARNKTLSLALDLVNRRFIFWHANNKSLLDKLPVK